MATVYNGLDTPRLSVSRVQALGLNTVRITDFLDVDGQPATAAYEEHRWRQVDRLIAAAASAGLFVQLDLSCYRNLLKNAGLNPYTEDWAPFLRHVVERRNSVTGMRYGDDPAIALVSFAGEVDAIHSRANTYGLTPDQLLEFYREVQHFWHRAAPEQLLTTGGLIHLDWESGVDWRAIFALPHNDVASIHVYSSGDLADSAPAVAAYSRALGKPWVVEEFGYPAELGDAERAARFSTMYAAAAGNSAAGVGFWNVGPQTTDTYDVGPQFPRTFDVVREHRPG
jgi:hypothetical protein